MNYAEISGVARRIEYTAGHVTFDIDPDDGQLATSVPCRVHKDALHGGRLIYGAAYTVIGRVTRAFFRAGGRTLSRTFVDASSVRPGGVGDG